jgi:hypothetical protein
MLWELGARWLVVAQIFAYTLKPLLKRQMGLV